MYEKKPWAHLYNRADWKRIRHYQLSAHPMCVMCRAIGRIEAATVCDHITPHKGDVEKFFAGPFQSLCKACHDGAKQSQDKTGKVRGCDANGNPLDASHHWHQNAPQGTQTQSSNDAALSGTAWQQIDS